MDWWRVRHGLKTLPRSNSGQTDSSLLHTSSEAVVGVSLSHPRLLKAHWRPELLWFWQETSHVQDAEQQAHLEAESSPSEPSQTGTDRTGSFIGSVTTLASHSYTTGYRTSYAGTDVEAGSLADSVVSRAPNLKRSMSRCISLMLGIVTSIHFSRSGCQWIPCLCT